MNGRLTLNDFLLFYIFKSYKHHCLNRALDFDFGVSKIFISTLNRVKFYFTLERVIVNCIKQLTSAICHHKNL